VHLLRCAGTAERQLGCYVGQRDFPAHERELAALRKFAEHFEYPQVDMVFTSPLSRCADTSQILYPEKYTETMPALMDLSLGEFEGKTPNELIGNSEYEAWISNSLENIPPGGEKVDDFTGRVTDALEDIFTRMMKERISNVAVITHAGVIMTMLSAAGIPKQPPAQWLVKNGCGFTLLMTPQMWMRSRCGEVFSRIPMTAVES